MEAKLGGQPIKPNDVADNFSWLQRASLEEVRCNGPQYSWTNNQQGESRVYSKLYSIFYNENWNDAYNTCFTAYHENVFFDHCYLLIKSISPDDLGVRPLNSLIYGVIFRGVQGVG